MRDGKGKFYKKLQVSKEIRKVIKFFREIKHKMMKDIKK